MGFDFKNNIKAPANKLSIDSIVGTVPVGRIEEIPISLIDSFHSHPFNVIDNEEMYQLAESVKANGVLNPAILIQKNNGRYELISGHRRKRACELAGKTTLTSEIRHMTEEEAVICMVDSNLQREKILPSEKAFAYKMKYDAMKKQVGRPTTEKLAPSAPISTGRTDELVGDNFGESKDTVRRYIRLTYLIKPLLDMVDNETLSIRAAVTISRLTEPQQVIILPYIERFSDKITAEKAVEIREWFEFGGSSEEEALNELFVSQAKQKAKNPAGASSIKFKQLKTYIPESILKDDYEDYVIKALIYYRNQIDMN